EKDPDQVEKVFVIPPARTRYLSEIAENNRVYDAQAVEQAELAQTLYGIFLALAANLSMTPKEAEEKLLDARGLGEELIDAQLEKGGSRELAGLLVKEFDRHKMQLQPKHWETIRHWDKKGARYKADTYTFKVRG